MPPTVHVKADLVVLSGFTRNFRADLVSEQWQNLTSDAWDVYNSLDEICKPSFFQMVLHPIRAVTTVTLLNIAAGRNVLYASQARFSANTLASEVLSLFAEDAALTRVRVKAIGVQMVGLVLAYGLSTYVVSDLR